MDEFAYEDHNRTLLLIGSEDDGSVYISVQDRDPVVLPPNVAETVAEEISKRARAGRELTS